MNHRTTGGLRAHVRGFLTYAVIASCVLAVGPGVSAESFTIVALPDTQNYVTSSTRAELFTVQTQWIRDQILNQGNPRNIQFVTHLGDMVSDGDSLTQLNRADTSMSVLDGVVSYSVLPGNHDYASTGNKATDTVDFIDFFGPQRFSGAPWFGGNDSSGNNTYQVIEAGGYTIIHLALEWRPVVNIPFRAVSPIEWAQSILDANPNTPFILSTHEHIDDSPPGRSGAGEDTWRELVRDNDQIFMVLSGHYHGAGGMNDGEFHQVSLNNANRTVFEVLQDFQDYPNGGNGWLRLIEFDIDANKIRIETFSPVLGQFQTETVLQVGGFASMFELDIDFAQRLTPVVITPPPSPFSETVFQQGVGGYVGTVDKEIRSSGNDATNGNAPSISVDGDDGNPGTLPNHGLVRFDNIIGNGPNQIAPGTPIESASLVLNVTNPGSGIALYQMTTPWNESSTWAGNLGGNGITPGTDAAPNPIQTINDIGTGTLRFDVTGAVRDWIDGQANFGLGMIPTGTNGVDFDTSEGNSPPALIVNTLAPGFLAAGFRNNVAGYSDTIDTLIREADPSTSYANETFVSIDTDDPNGSNGDNHYLIRFENIIGSGADQVPTTPGTTIIRADLIVDAFDPGDGANIHRLLQGWTDTVTWSSGFGGNGVQANDLEAIAMPDSSGGGGSGLVTLDVTRGVQAWIDGADNFGWALLPRGGNGWDFDTAEGSFPPQLQVYYRYRADCNDTRTVDAADLDDLNACWLGAGNGLAEGCDCHDLDADGDITLADVALQQREATSS